MNDLRPLIDATDALINAHSSLRSEPGGDTRTELKRARATLNHTVRQFCADLLEPASAPSQTPEVTVPAEQRAPSALFTHLRDFLHSCVAYATQYSLGPLGLPRAEQDLIAALQRARATLA